MYLQPLSRLGPKYVGVMTLTCHGHVTSSVTWPPFDSPYPISYWWSFGTEHLFVSVFEILGPKHIAIALQSPIWNGLSLQVIRVIDVKKRFSRFNVFLFCQRFLFFKNVHWKFPQSVWEALFKTQKRINRPRCYYESGCVQSSCTVPIATRLLWLHANHALGDVSTWSRELQQTE